MPVSSSFELDLNQQAQLNAMVWEVLQHAVKDKTFELPQPPEDPVLLQLGASFVTLYVHEQLRGCTGICEPQSPLWQDVCNHAYSSLKDRRFTPIEAWELGHLSFHISVLSPMNPMLNLGELKLREDLVVGKDGLVLEQQYRHAVFLPSVWRNLQTPRAFIRALKHKGGWPENYWHPSIKLFRFSTFEFVCDPNQR